MHDSLDFQSQDQSFEDALDRNISIVCLLYYTTSIQCLQLWLFKIRIEISDLFLQGWCIPGARSGNGYDGARPLE